MNLEEQLEAVKKDIWIFPSIKNPCLEVQLAAVKNYGFSIKFISNPSLEVQLAAVKNIAWSISCISNPCLEVQLEAAKQTEHLNYIKYPHPQLKEKLIEFIVEEIEKDINNLKLYRHFEYLPEKYKLLSVVLK